MNQSVQETKKSGMLNLDIPAVDKTLFQTNRLFFVFFVVFFYFDIKTYILLGLTASPR